MESIWHGEKNSTYHGASCGCIGLLSSIRAKFMVLFIIFGLIPLVVVSTFSYMSASNSLLNQTREQLGNLADKTAQQIDIFFVGAKKDIQLLANFPFIQLSFLQFEFGQRLETARRLVEDYLLNNPYYHRILLIGLDGKPILTVPEGPVKDENVPAWLAVAKSQDLYLSRIIVRQPTSESYLVLTKQVMDFEDRQKAVGILAFEIRLPAFTTYVSSLKLGTQGYSFLLNKNGTIIYHPDTSLDSLASLLRRGDDNLAQLVEKMMKGLRGYGEYLFRGQEKYIVFTPCRDKEWSVGITLQRSEFMAGIIKLRQRVMTFATVIVILISLASLLFVKSLTQPIAHLISGARSIGAGDLDQTINVASSDEFQSLAREFNNMAARLKKSMQQIVELKTFNDDIFRSVSSGIVTVDEAGKITSVNRSAGEIFSLPSQKYSSNSDGETPGCLGLSQTLDLLMKTLEINQAVENQIMDFTDRDSQIVFIEVNTALLSDGNGQVIGAIADIRDITSRKQMEELMVRVDKLASLGELSAGIAHEIRNPLAGMKTSIQVLAKKITGSSQKILLSGILSEIDRLNAIVTDLLKFSGSSPSFPGPVDIQQVLKKTLDLVKEKINKARIQVVTDYAQDLPLALLDREQIQQVFLNLILNAINAMPKGGKLTIAAKPIEDQERLRELIDRSFDPARPTGIYFLQIRFTDTGVGIKKENLSRVFNPFFTTDPNGTGLGLSITHKLLEKNKAYITLNSKPGQGCHVTLILPMVEEYM